MARITVVIKSYGFRKPPLMHEDEFLSYKQIFNVDPNYNMNPNRPFWDEFAFVKWCLIALISGALLSLISNLLGLIAGVAFFLLFISMISGTARSMFNYQHFLKVKNRYYNALKKAIINSNSYNEFRIASSKL